MASTTSAAEVGGMVDHSVLPAMAAVVTSLKCAMEAVRSSEQVLMEVGTRLAEEMSSMSQAMENLETQWTSLPEAMRSRSIGDFFYPADDIFVAAAPTSSAFMRPEWDAGQTSGTLKVFDLSCDDSSEDGEESIADASDYGSPALIEVPTRQAQSKPMLQSGTVVSVEESPMAAFYDPGSNVAAAALRNTEILKIPAMAHSPRLITGGLDKHRIVLIGNLNNTAGVLSSAEILCLDQMTFMPALSMSCKRRDEALEEGRILVGGGCSEADETSDTTEIFELAVRRFVKGPHMPTPRTARASARVDDDHILLAGGSDGRDALRSREIFDRTPTSSGPGPEMEIERNGCAVCALGNGEALIAGGNDGDGSLRSTETLDLAAMVFRAGPTMLVEREDFTLQMCTTTMPPHDSLEWVTDYADSAAGGVKLDEAEQIRRCPSPPAQQKGAEFLVAREWEELCSASGTETDGSDRGWSDVTAENFFFVEPMELDWSDQESSVVDGGSPKTKPVQGWEDARADAYDADLVVELPNMPVDPGRHEPGVKTVQQPRTELPDLVDLWHVPSRKLSKQSAQQEEMVAELPDLADLCHVPSLSQQSAPEKAAEARELVHAERVVQHTFEQSIQQLTVAEGARREAGDTWHAIATLICEPAVELNRVSWDPSEDFSKEEWQRSCNSGGRSLYECIHVEKGVWKHGLDLLRQTPGQIADLGVANNERDSLVKGTPNELVDVDKVCLQKTLQAPPTGNSPKHPEAEKREGHVAQKTTPMEARRENLEVEVVKIIPMEEQRKDMKVEEVKTTSTEKPHEYFDVKEVKAIPAKQPHENLEMDEVEAILAEEPHEDFEEVGATQSEGPPEDFMATSVEEPPRNFEVKTATTENPIEDLEAEELKAAPREKPRENLEVGEVEAALMEQPRKNLEVEEVEVTPAKEPNENLEGEEVEAIPVEEPLGHVRATPAGERCDDLVVEEVKATHRNLQVEEVEAIPLEELCRNLDKEEVAARRLEEPHTNLEAGEVTATLREKPRDLKPRVVKATPPEEPHKSLKVEEVKATPMEEPHENLEEVEEIIATPLEEPTEDLEVEDANATPMEEQRKSLEAKVVNAIPTKAPHGSLEAEEVRAMPADEPHKKLEVQEVERQVAQDAIPTEEAKGEKELSGGSQVEEVEHQTMDEHVATGGVHDKLDVEEVERQARDRLARRFAAAEEKVAVREGGSGGALVPKLPAQVSQAVGGLAGCNGQGLCFIKSFHGGYLFPGDWYPDISNVRKRWKITTNQYTGISYIKSPEGKFLTSVDHGEDVYLLDYFSPGCKWQLVPCGTCTYIKSVHGTYLASKPGEEWDKPGEECVYMSPKLPGWWERWTFQ